MKQSKSVSWSNFEAKRLPDMQIREEWGLSLEL